MENYLLPHRFSKSTYGLGTAPNKATEAASWYHAGDLGNSSLEILEIAEGKEENKINQPEKRRNREVKEKSMSI